ncbi:MAG: hypothetical protein O2887_09230 [Bacteroidetes bacterium]|nr:hypothetical protein [Bacteroidota bacterium]MDA1120654.1 hypothetical protein [Bacteroidota bacterium]
MKNIPIIPILMWTIMVLVIINGHRVSRKSEAKANYSMAGGVDAHLSKARNAFIENDKWNFLREMEDASVLLSKEAFCEKCLDHDVAKEGLSSIVDIKHKYERGVLTIELMNQAFGNVINSLAKNHIIYTLEHMGEINEEFYLEDAVRHLKYSMEFASSDIKEKEELAKAALEEALINHELDPEQTKRILDAVVAGI